MKSQATRSRTENRKIARRVLAEKLEEMELGDQSRAKQKEERARKKKASKTKKSKRKYRALEAANNANNEENEEEDDIADPEEKNIREGKTGEAVDKSPEDNPSNKSLR